MIIPFYTGTDSNPLFTFHILM